MHTYIYIYTHIYSYREKLLNSQSLNKVNIVKSGLKQLFVNNNTQLASNQ